MTNVTKYLIPIISLALAGCSAGGGRPTTTTAVSGPVSEANTVRNAALPGPTGSDTGTEAQPYRVGALDILTIDVYGLPEFAARDFQADASGRIAFPLVGTIEAAGKTPIELAEVIRGRLRQNYIRDPKVTVNVKEINSRVVTVDGQVREPGVYPVVADMTLLRAIASARGTTDNARQSNVLIFRTVQGQKLAGIYDLRAIRRGTYEDPRVYPNDVVVVSDNQARRLLGSSLGIFSALASPILILLTR